MLFQGLVSDARPRGVRRTRPLASMTLKQALKETGGARYLPLCLLTADVFGLRRRGLVDWVPHPYDHRDLCLV